MSLYEFIGYKIKDECVEKTKIYNYSSYALLNFHLKSCDGRVNDLDKCFQNLSQKEKVQEGHHSTNVDVFGLILQLQNKYQLH